MGAGGEHSPRAGLSPGGGGLLTAVSNTTCPPQPGGHRASLILAPKGLQCQGGDHLGGDVIRAMRDGLTREGRGQNGRLLVPETSLTDSQVFETANHVLCGVALVRGFLFSL